MGASDIPPSGLGCSCLYQIHINDIFRTDITFGAVSVTSNLSRDRFCAEIENVATFPKFEHDEFLQRSRSPDCELRTRWLIHSPQRFAGKLHTCLKASVNQSSRIKSTFDCYWGITLQKH